MKAVMESILYAEQEKYLDNFLKSGDPLLKEMEDYADKFKVPILYKESAVFLEQLLYIKKPKLVLELGTAIAYSSIRIARCLKKKGELHTIEKSKDNIAVAKKNIKKSGFRNKIRLFEGEALEVMKSFDKKYDFIFLDADKKDYRSLFDLSLKLLKKNGVIFIDNLLWHGYSASENVPPEQKNSTQIIRDFNKYFSECPLLKTSILSIGDGIGVGIKISSKIKN